MSFGISVGDMKEVTWIFVLRFLQNFAYIFYFNSKIFCEYSIFFFYEELEFEKDYLIVLRVIDTPPLFE